MTVPYRALKFGRKAVAFELNKEYFADGAGYCYAMEAEVSVPTLFDMEGLEDDRGQDDYTAIPEEIEQMDYAQESVD